MYWNDSDRGRSRRVLCSVTMRCSMQKWRECGHERGVARRDTALVFLSCWGRTIQADGPTQAGPQRYQVRFARCRRAVSETAVQKRSIQTGLWPRRARARPRMQYWKSLCMRGGARAARDSCMRLILRFSDLMSQILRSDVNTCTGTWYVQIRVFESICVEKRFE